MKSSMLQLFSLFLLETNLLFTGIHSAAQMERFCCCHSIMLTPFVCPWTIIKDIRDFQKNLKATVASNYEQQSHLERCS